MAKELSKAKKWLSNWYPQRLLQSRSFRHPKLEILLYKGRLQLGTPEAIYSDGDQYWPALALANVVDLCSVPLKNVTVLGVGLASVVQILEARGHHPYYRLVDFDPQILIWARDFLPEGVEKRARIMEDEVEDYLLYRGDPGIETLVFVDLFHGLKVWPGVHDPSFLYKVRGLLHPGGIWAMNYIVEDIRRWEKMIKTAMLVFPRLEISHNGNNRLLWARV